MVRYHGLDTYQCKAGRGRGGGGRQGIGWGFDIFQKFAVNVPAHGQIIPVKCAVRCPKAGSKKGTINISPNKILKSYLYYVAASPKIHVPVTAAIIRLNHNACYTA